MIPYIVILTSWHVTQLCRAVYTAGSYHEGDTHPKQQSDTVVSFTYAIVIFDVNICSLVNKDSHFVNLALLNS